MDEIGVLRDMHPAQSFDRSEARMAARETLRASIATELEKTAHRRRRPVIWKATPALGAVLVAVAALALVPVGGASLGQRAVDGVTSLWDTPPNQDALDVAAGDAQSVAGDAYYTAAAVNDSANTVDVYLANAPQSIIDQLQATHPGTYVIHNDAAHPLSQLLQLQHKLKLGPLQTASGNVNVLSSDPTLDGHLKVGIQGKGNVQAAQSALDALYGPEIVEVYGGAEPDASIGLSGSAH